MCDGRYLFWVTVRFLDADPQHRFLLELSWESSKVEEGLLAWGESIRADERIRFAEELAIVRAELLFVRIWGLSASLGERDDVSEVDSTFLT